MKYPVRVLAWPLTIAVTLAEKDKVAAEVRVKDELLEKDPEKYKDAVVHLQVQEKPFLEEVDRSTAKESKTKKGLRTQATGRQEEQATVGDPSDTGTLKLYQVGGNTNDLARGRAVSIEKGAEEIYMLIDWEGARGKAATKEDRKVPSVSVEGDIHLTGDHSPTNMITDRRKERSSPLGSGVQRHVRHLGRTVDKNHRRRLLLGGNKFSRRMFQSPNNGQATGNHHQDNKVLLNGCVQGTSSFVTEKCRFFNCCNGEDACTWPDDQIATVCPDSCNGYKACYYIGAGTYVGRDSCNSRGRGGGRGGGAGRGRSGRGRRIRFGYACSYFASRSTKAASRIGRNSCNGDQACTYVCYSSKDCKATIGDDACNGELSCGYVGEPSRSSNFQIESVNIGDRSCLSYEYNFACAFFGSNARFVSIGDDSCLGLDACYAIGYYVPLRVKIGDGSCTDSYSCQQLGEEAGYDGEKSKVIVGDRSCTSFDACYLLGSDTYYDVQVGDDSCRRFRSCSMFGEEVTSGPVRVGDNQCTQVEECYSTACENTQYVPNSGTACP